jgi:hypothetical protein
MAAAKSFPSGSSLRRAIWRGMTLGATNFPDTDNTLGFGATDRDETNGGGGAGAGGGAARKVLFNW